MDWITGVPGGTSGGRALLLSGGRVSIIPEKGELGILFCREDGGTMEISAEGCSPVSPEPRTISLFTTPFSLELSVEERLSVVVLLRCGDLGLPESCVRLMESLWSHSLFDILNCLSRRDLGHYCVWKAEEMLYLLERGGLSLASGPENTAMGLNHIHLAQQGDAYIRAHLQEDLSIDTVARVLYTSPTTLKRCYRQAFGESIHRAVTRYRMERASVLLSTTTLTVRDIAAEVGYDSVSQFSTVFQRSTGTSPGRFRRAKKV